MALNIFRSLVGFVPMRLLLVDGNYYVYRSFFAIRGLSNSRGEPTNAIYGFTKAIRKMIADIKPDLGAIAWDEGMPLHRTTLQPEYKQNRSEMPDEMRPQLQFLRKMTPLMGLTAIASPDSEADDWIACYTKEATRKGIEVVIATNDKDIFQLVGPGVSIYSTNKTDLPASGEPFALLGEEAVHKRWSVGPGNIADILALTGDSSDNIPGVPGIGEKTAAKLVQEFGSIPSLYEKLELVSNEKIREKLRASKELVFTNLKMVALYCEHPLSIPVEDLRIKPDYPALIDAVRDCEFKSLLIEIEKEAQTAKVSKQGELF
ncbi:MAG: 5'-3' exonuclease H3TH domain-containing protein [Chthoniobacterales bacterium]